MAFQPVIKCAEVVAHFTYDGHPVVNVMHFQSADEMTEAELQTLAESVGDWVISDYLPTCGARTLYEKTTSRSLTTATAYQGIHTTGAGTAGSHAFSEPLNVTKAFTLASSLTGRNARGRLFHAGLPNDALTDPNHVAQSWVDDVVDALEALKVIVEALGLIWVVVSRFVAGVKRTEGVMYPITSFRTSNLTTDSQRGRLPTS